jgi:hypothetical protein
MTKRLKFSLQRPKTHRALGPCIDLVHYRASALIPYLFILVLKGLGPFRALVFKAGYGKLRFG